MNDVFKTIASPVEEVIFKEKSSKFLGYAFPIQTEEDVKRHLEAVKKLHHSARHWCYAWQLGHGAQQHYRANDDGEPNNSAGIPIYGQIQSFDLTNVLIIVVRYFGGIKLGVGGLVQAYKTSAQLTLQEAEIIEKIVTQTLQIVFDYKDMNKVMRVVKEKNLEVIDQKLGLDCRLFIEVRNSEWDHIKAIFESIYGVQVIENERK
ncbi:YigZ family protein [Capnocytophaga canis]|uniref:YigZ family protein n=1 Tax=Capnocytophaga canis TaxID=1848903 RepID=A0A3A1YKV4_9FLAO|nr:YigZ family protein [Capnocytophaga canis]RIY37650.1 YigZ family protein [Capnocytophaga canis]